MLLHRSFIFAILKEKEVITMKHTRILTLLLCLVLLLTACGSSAPTDEMDMALDNGYYAADGEYGRVPGETMASSEL